MVLRQAGGPDSARFAVKVRRVVSVLFMPSPTLLISARTCKLASPGVLVGQIGFVRRIRLPDGFCGWACDVGNGRCRLIDFAHRDGRHGPTE